MTDVTLRSSRFFTEHELKSYDDLEKVLEQYKYVFLNEVHQDLMDSIKLTLTPFYSDEEKFQGFVLDMYLNISK